MALYIEDEEVERLVADVMAMTGETQDEAILNAMLERKAHLGL